MYIVQMIDGLSMGGAQQLQVTLARQAKRRGFKLAILSLSRDNDSPFLEELKELGAALYFFPTSRIFDLKNLARILKWFLSERPDILHAHLTYSIIVGSIVRLLTRIPLVATLHNTGDVQKKVYTRTEQAEIFSLRHLVSAIIACGPAAARQFSVLIKNKPIHVIPNAVDYQNWPSLDFDREALRAQIMGNSAGTFLLTVGRLTQQKGVEDLVESFSLLHQTFPDSFLVIAGDGELKIVIEQKIRALGLTDCVRLLGNRKDVLKLMRACDIFVLASRWEGLPIVILEAMASGLPIVATNVGDNAWALASTGIVVPARQPRLFASAIESLLKQPEERHSLGQSARNRIVEKFSPSEWFNETISVYNSHLQQG